MTSSSIQKYIRTAEGCFICPFCSEIKKKQNTMLYHIQSKHTNEYAYTCDRCPSDTAPKFVQKCSYLHHLATSHPENPHPTSDMKNQYAEKQYECPMCKHSSHTRGNIIIHFVRNHMKEYIPNFEKNKECTSCKSLFNSSGAYLYHATECFKSSIPISYMNMLSRIR